MTQEGSRPGRWTLPFGSQRTIPGGHALVMAVVFVFLLTLFGLAFYRFAETDVDLIANDRMAAAALYAAQGGLEKAAWILKNHRIIEEGNDLSLLNPFSTTFYAGEGPQMQDFQQVAHDSQEFLSPGGGEYPRYFRINRVDARSGENIANPDIMACVSAQVLGAVDLDGDGEAGLTDVDSEGFPIDRDDINRRFEAVLGLPGSLSEYLSAGAPTFTYGNIPPSFPTRNEQLRSQTDYDVPSTSGFLYYQLGSLGEWDQYAYVFGKPLKQGPIDLPPGLFDNDGKAQLAYFAGLDVRAYSGNQVFHRGNDPTAGNSGRPIVYVDGDVTIRDVDFGYLDASGVLREADWEETDVTVIATGMITVKDIQCGDVSRLTLIAGDILLVGDYDTRINGIALAGRTITLDDQETTSEPHGCPDGILKNGEKPDEPIRYTAYFIGTLLAGQSINLRNAGWTVLFDEKVLNGLMHEAGTDRPTLIYETAENEDGLFPYPKWREIGHELEGEQEAYTPDEIARGDGASWDGGEDEKPDLMQITHQPLWSVSSLFPDRHNYGIEDGLELDFSVIQDWSNYRAITFMMSLDNWKEESEGKESSRMFFFRLRTGVIEPTDPQFTLDKLDGYYDHPDDPGEGAWKKVRIPLAAISPTGGFDIENVEMIRFILDGYRLSWTNAAGNEQWIDYDHVNAENYGVQGKFVFHLGYTDLYGKDSYPVRFWEESPLRHRLYYTEAKPGIDPHQMPGDTGFDPACNHDIQWMPDPATGTMETLYFEDQFVPNLRIDQIQVRGRPDSNTFLEYGLPRCFRYAVTHLREYQTF